MVKLSAKDISNTSKGTFRILCHFFIFVSNMKRVIFFLPSNIFISQLCRLLMNSDLQPNSEPPLIYDHLRGETPCPQIVKQAC